jgi:hypothetical protein
MLEFKQYVMGKLNESTEETDLPDDFTTEGGANVFYYIGRLIENKGPQTEGSLEKYLETKFDIIPYVELKRYPGKKIYWMNFVSSFFYKDGRRWDFTADGHDWWEDVAKWHDNKAREEDPYAAVVKMFWDWYKAKKAGKNDDPDDEVINFVNKAAPATIEKAFGKYYKFAMGLLEPYMKNSQLTDEDRMIQKFWDWHRAKKAGKPYPLDQDTIDGLVVFLRKPKAVEVLQQYYYYFVRVIENLSDKNIKTPINTDGLQKELKRIMDNLDNDEFVDELEKIERNRLHGGDMTAGPVFVLPVDVIKTIRTLAKDDDNIVKSKVGKIDKDQVKECYTYCNNELNRKFHIGKTGIFDLNIQDFYDTYKIVFQRGFNQKTLHKIFDEVCQYLLDQLDKGTAEYWKNRGKIEIDDVEDFNEAYKALKSAGYTILKEDKYMDDIENELDQTVALSNILDSIKKQGYKKCGIKNDAIYVWPVEDNERYCVVIEPNEHISIHNPYDFLCFILDREESTHKMSWGYSINKDDEYSYDPCISYVTCYNGPVKDIIKPGEKKITKLTQPGFFKRLFKNESVEDDAEEGILSVWDREKIKKGQTPSWAKSVTELKPKAKKVKGSSSWSERAMRGVVGEREPQTESEWRLDNELNYKANKKLADIIRSKIEGDYQITKDCVTLFADNGLRFEIYPGGWDYKVKKINPDKLSDRDFFENEKLDKCIEWIEGQV